MTDKNEDRIADLTDALQQLQSWVEAYPIDIFPEPDLKKAAELLRAGGLTLDAVSASASRHVLAGIKKIVNRALAKESL